MLSPTAIELGSLLVGQHQLGFAVDIGKAVPERHREVDPVTGGIVRLDRRTSERVNIKPVEGKGEPSRLYFGANKLFRSDDRGNTWRAISPDLTRQTDRNLLPVMGKAWPPEAIAQHQSTATLGNISALAESRKREGLLYVGTEFGLFFTTDGGQKWIRLRNNLPTIAVRDLAIQERENDLVLGTFGRGFYVLDDYSALRQVSAAVFQRDGHIFATKTATLAVPETGRARGSQGEQLWMGENLPEGAVLTYWVREAPRTQRQRRQDAARAAEQKKETPPYPSQAELTAEADEEPPQTFLAGP